jgi:hypothetical protein
VNSDYIKWFWSSDAEKKTRMQANEIFALSMGYSANTAKLIIMPPDPAAKIDVIDQVKDDETTTIDNGVYFIASSLPFRALRMFFAPVFANFHHFQQLDRKKNSLRK